VADGRGSKSSRAVLVIALTGGGLALAIIHVARPSLKIDTTTLILLGVALLPWLGTVLDSVELPGGFKAKFREQLAQVKEQVAKIENIVFSGATPEQEQRLRKAINAFKAYLAGLGLTVTDFEPYVTVRDRPYRGFASAYGPDKNTIFVMRELADDKAFVLHEYCHVVLFETVDIYSEKQLLHFCRSSRV
jgi:hypothetical protein